MDIKEDLVELLKNTEDSSWLNEEPEDMDPKPQQQMWNGDNPGMTIVNLRLYEEYAQYFGITIQKD